MIIQITASANGHKDYFHKTMSDSKNERAINEEAVYTHDTLKKMLKAHTQSPVFEFLDDDLGYVMINVQSYNFITVRVIEEHVM